MSQKLPFSLTRRKNSRYWYVRFKSESGDYLSAVSTKKDDYNEAVKVAYQWYSSGQIESPGKSQSINEKNILQSLKNSELSEEEAGKILELLQQKGILKSYVKAGDKSDINFNDFLLAFWDWDNSEYIKERQRKGKRIGLSYVEKSKRFIERFWLPFFKDKILGEITKQELRDFLLYIQGIELSNSYKNQIWISGAEPLRWAYYNELIDRDITAGLSGFSQQSEPRQILTPELAAALFRVEWNDERYKLGNLLAMCTGLRMGEIRGLQKKDLGENCLYIQHSWNDLEGLKAPKNNKSRKVLLPFPGLSRSLLELAEKNPYDQSMDAFVFFATIPGQPIEKSGFLSALRAALKKIGMTEGEARKYCFHGWRHFYASYMRDHVNEKQLQSQTGHRTLSMLEHYSEHEIEGDKEKIMSAQEEVFGSIVENTQISFDKKRIYQNVKVSEMNKSGLYEHSRADRPK